MGPCANRLLKSAARERRHRDSVTQRADPRPTGNAGAAPHRLQLSRSSSTTASSVNMTSRRKPSRKFQKLG
eukprot:3029505-Alexandrium_andersonii.AAC.1